MNPVEMRSRGAEILEPILKPCGFTFASGDVGKGSGGAYAQGAFVRSNRRLEFSVRHSLGLVEYHVGQQRITHDDYMRIVSKGENSYPGFSDDPLDGFRHLASDLKNFCGAFLNGSDADFESIRAAAQGLPPKKGFSAVSRLR